MLYECPQCHAECTADLTKDPTVKCPSCGFSLSTARRTDLPQEPPPDGLQDTVEPPDVLRPELPPTVDLEEAVPVADLEVRATDQDAQDVTKAPAAAGSENENELGAPLRWIGRYRIERYIDSGSFGDVYRAVDAKLNRAVAIKVPRRAKFDSDEHFQRFLRSFHEEGRRAAQLNHPGIVQTYDVEFDEATRMSYIVMEFVDGGTLEHRLRADRPSLVVVVDWLAQVADAVHYAHKQGFIHRDLKPNNILIDSSGRARVVDFGLALHEEEQRRHRGQVAGTTAYMSPEQVLGRSEHLDGRADVWSLGAIMYRALTGRFPFGGTDAEKREQILEREPKPFSQINDALPRELEQICLRGCLVKSVAERLPSARDLRDALRAWLDAQRAPGNGAAGAMCLPSGRQDEVESRASTTANESSAPSDSPQVDSRRRWMRRAALATAAVLGVPVGVYAIVARRRSVHPFADRFLDVPDVDRLATINVPYNLLARAPVEIIWPDSEVRSWGWHSQEQTLTVSSETASYLALGRTNRSDFKLEIEFSKKPLVGYSGFFLGMAPAGTEEESDFGLNSGRAFIDGPWNYQGIVFNKADRTPMMIEQFTQGLRLTTTGFDGGERRQLQAELAILSDKSPILEIEVRGGQLQELAFNRNLLRDLNRRIPDNPWAARICRGWFGILNSSGTVTVERAQFTPLK